MKKPQSIRLANGTRINFFETDHPYVTSYSIFSGMEDTTCLHKGPRYFDDRNRSLKCGDCGEIVATYRDMLAMRYRT